MTAIFEKNPSRYLHFHIVANFDLKNISTEMILNNSGFCHHKIHRSKIWKRSKTDFFFSFYTLEPLANHRLFDAGTSLILI